MPLDATTLAKHGMVPDLSSTTHHEELELAAIHEAGHVLLAFSNGWHIDGVVVHTVEYCEANPGLPGGRIMTSPRLCSWDLFKFDRDNPDCYDLPWCREVVFRELAFAAAGTVAELVKVAPKRGRLDFWGFAFAERNSVDWQHFAEYADLLEGRTGKSSMTFGTKAIHHAYGVIRSPDGQQFIRDRSAELTTRRFLTDADCRRHWWGKARSDSYYGD